MKCPPWPLCKRDDGGRQQHAEGERQPVRQGFQFQFCLSGAVLRRSMSW